MPSNQVKQINLSKIISGGQTGVDRAALDGALHLDLPTGGWCPKGRLAEDGIIPEKYLLKCTPLDSYSQRTEWNVRDSQGTLIITRKKNISGGTAFTLKIAEKLKKPYLLVDPDSEIYPEQFYSWLVKYRIRILNIAGPRESTYPGIYKKAYDMLLRLFI